MNICLNVINWKNMTYVILLLVLVLLLTHACLPRCDIFNNTNNTTCTLNVAFTIVIIICDLQYSQELAESWMQTASVTTNVPTNTRSAMEAYVNVSKIILTRILNVVSVLNYWLVCACARVCLCCGVIFYSWQVKITYTIQCDWNMSKMPKYVYQIKQFQIELQNNYLTVMVSQGYTNVFHIRNKTKYWLKRHTEQSRRFACSAPAPLGRCVSTRTLSAGTGLAGVRRTTWKPQTPSSVVSLYSSSMFLRI